MTNISSLALFKSCNLDLFYPFCDTQSLIALASTKREAASKMRAIWVRFLAGENLFCYTTKSLQQNSENLPFNEVTHIHHIFGAEFYKESGRTIEPDQSENVKTHPCIRKNDIFPDPDQNTHIKKKILSCNTQLINDDMRVRDKSTPQFIGRTEKNAWIQYLFQEKMMLLKETPLKYIVPTDQPINDFLRTFLTAIHYNQCELFDFLETERRRYPEGLHHNITSILLAYAAKCGRIEIFSMLLQTCKDINVKVNPHSVYFQEWQSFVETINQNLHSYLMYAAFYGRLKVVKLLIASKADVNGHHTDESSENNKEAVGTPLMAAIQQRSISIVETLLNAKADPKGPHLLLAFRAEKTPPPVRYPGRSPKQTKKEQQLARNEYKTDMQLALMLLEAKANPNECNEDGLPPLMYASAAGDLKAIQMLLQAKADVNKMTKVNSFSETALHTAAKAYQIGSVDTLLHSKADMNQSDKQNPILLSALSQKSPLQFTSCFIETQEKSSLADMISFLIQAKAEVDNQGKDKQTALMRAARNRDVDSVRVLLENRANCNAMDAQEQTSLHHVVNSRGGGDRTEDGYRLFNGAQKLPGIVKILLQHGAIDRRSKKGKTAHECALQKVFNQKEYQEVGLLLKQHDWLGGDGIGPIPFQSMPSFMPVSDETPDRFIPPLSHGSQTPQDKPFCQMACNVPTDNLESIDQFLDYEAYSGSFSNIPPLEDIDEEVEEIYQTPNAKRTLESIDDFLDYEAYSTSFSKMPPLEDIEEDDEVEELYQTPNAKRAKQ